MKRSRYIDVIDSDEIQVATRCANVILAFRFWHVRKLMLSKSVYRKQLPHEQWCNVFFRSLIYFALSDGYLCKFVRHILFFCKAVSPSASYAFVVVSVMQKSRISACSSGAIVTAQCFRIWDINKFGTNALSQLSGFAWFQCLAVLPWLALRVIISE